MPKMFLSNREMRSLLLQATEEERLALTKLLKPIKIHPNFKLVYEYQKDKLNSYLMVSYQLCDAFFSDILRRKGDNRLYKVTSTLASLFLDGTGTDAILYSSVQTEGGAVLAIKPCKIDEKLEHISTLAMHINKNYGYGIYNTSTLYTGIIKGDDIEWQHVN